MGPVSRIPVRDKVDSCMTSGAVAHEVGDPNCCSKCRCAYTDGQYQVPLTRVKVMRAAMGQIVAAIGVAGALTLMTSCDGSSTPAAPSTSTVNTLSFVSSSPQDFVGQGRSVTLAAPSSVFVGQMTDNNRRLQIGISVGNQFVWNLRLVAPPGQRLEPRRYVNATFASPDTAQIELSGENRSCGQNLAGEFEVLTAQYGPPQPATTADPAISGTIVRFHARFTQRCSQSAPALTGEISVSDLPRIGAVVLR